MTTKNKPNKKHFGLILAGGQGTRFWPWSTGNFPKQFLNIIGDDPLITQTFNRLKTFIPEENIFVIAENKYLPLVMNSIPNFRESNFIDEPIPRNTAPSLMLANVYLSAIDPEANVLVVPSDHFIPDTEIFASQMSDALNYADNKFIVTCGIKPNMPHTGYGYIQFNPEKSTLSGETYFYDFFKFREKPKVDVAKQYLEEKNYFWNAGMFIYKLSNFKEFLGKYADYYYGKYLELETAYNQKSSLVSVFTDIKPESIDYALMEKLSEVKMFKANFEWNDLGAWTTVYELNPKDEQNNVSRGSQNVFIDSKDSMIFSTTDTPVATIGLNNIAVINTPNGILVANMDELQRVKEAIQKLSEISKSKK